MAKMSVPLRVSLALIGISLAGVCGYWFHELRADKEPAASPVVRLTVDETMGAALLMGFEESHCGIAWKGANPVARKPLMRMMLADRSESRAAWLMYGGCAGEEDLETIRLILKMRFQGTLSEDEINMVRGICDAVGLMVFRKVPGADELHREMLAHQFWNELPFRFDDPKTTRRSFVQRNPPWSFLLTAYVFVGGKDLEKQIRRLAQETDDSQMRAWLLDPKTPVGIRENAKEAALRAATPITEEFRKELRDQWNGDVDDPRLRIRSPEELAAMAEAQRVKPPVVRDLRRDGELPNELKEEIRMEADAALVEIRKLFDAKNTKALVKRVVRRGTVVPDMADRKDLSGLDQSAVIIAEWFKRIDDTRPTPGKASVEAWTEDTGMPNGTTRSVEIVKVRYRLEKSQPVGKAFREAFSDRADFATMDKDDAFVVILVKRDNVWHWNPFGW